MTKAELVEIIASQTGVSKKDTGLIVNLIWKTWAARWFRKTKSSCAVLVVSRSKTAARGWLVTHAQELRSWCLRRKYRISKLPTS